MPRLRPLKVNEVIRVLQKLGFQQVRQSGSHAVFKHQDGRWTTVPIHRGRDLGKGLISRILNDVGVSFEEFTELI